jgi:hypothetical protein
VNSQDEGMGKILNYLRVLLSSFFEGGKYSLFIGMNLTKLEYFKELESNLLIGYVMNLVMLG